MATARQAGRRRSLDWLQPAVLVGSVAPLLVIAWKAASGGLGANPIATALNQLGLLALILLLASLACTPLKILFGWKWPLRVRKTLGLCAFWIALTHFLVYLLFDQAMALGAVFDDILKRPFIAVGAGALVLLLPLAVTSTKAALQRLGPKRWQRLHRLAYLAAGLGVIHYFMRVKQDTREPLLYALLLAVLLLARLANAVKRRSDRVK